MSTYEPTDQECKKWRKAFEVACYNPDFKTFNFANAMPSPVKFDQEEIELMDTIHSLLLKKEDMDFIRDVIGDMDDGTCSSIILKLIERGRIDW